MRYIYIYIHLTASIFITPLHILWKGKSLFVLVDMCAFVSEASEQKQNSKQRMEELWLFTFTQHVQSSWPTADVVCRKQKHFGQTEERRKTRRKEGWRKNWCQCFLLKLCCCYCEGKFFIWRQLEVAGCRLIGRPLLFLLLDDVETVPPLLMYIYNWVWIEIKRWSSLPMLW